MEPTPQPGPSDPTIPERLRRALTRVYGHDAETHRLDHAVLTEASRRLRRRSGASRRVWTGSGAAAAALALAGLTVWAVRASSDARDVNRDGVVDILDALALDRAVRAGAGGPDLNGDGLADTADVDALAMVVVRVHGAPG